ncbi:MAG TPA: ThuA domain-containing protein [Acidimicrobiales bacterium]|nr:ThuA domain-containing protein [Acidimicrobiales bacterium]
MTNERRRVLVVRGGWAGHEPVGTTDRLIPLLIEEGFEVEISGSLECYATPAVMEDLDLIVQCWTMGEISPGQLSGLLSAIAAGTGLTGWHGGLCDAFRNSPDYQFMTGGQWVAHPGGAIDYEVNFMRVGADPLIAGLEDFRLRSEQYYMHVDPSNIVLATTTFQGTEDAPWTKGCVMPVAWKRTYGKGRVFYSALGHEASDFDVSQVLELVLRGSLWASRSATRMSRLAAEG